MDFDQHVHAEFEGAVLQRARFVVREARHDDEGRVGAPATGLVDLVGLEQKKSLRSAGRAVAGTRGR